MIATLSATDAYHQRCRAVLATIRVQLITTWPCITEAMHLLDGRGQEALRQQIEQGMLDLHTPTIHHAQRACALMRQYADAPMDFADASLVVAAEVLGITRILTLDRHFYAYRINGNASFEVLP